MTTGTEIRRYMNHPFTIRKAVADIVINNINTLSRILHSNFLIAIFKSKSKLKTKKLTLVFTLDFLI